jgi:hypothetical protein
MKYKRNGDHYLHNCNEIKGKVVKHNGRFVFGVGEASNHFHVITTKNPSDLIIKKDEKSGLYYFELLTDGLLMHTEGNSDKIADHRTIPIKKGKYRQVLEREVDIFSQAVRLVKD